MLICDAGETSAVAMAASSLHASTGATRALPRTENVNKCPSCTGSLLLSKGLVAGGQPRSASVSASTPMLLPPFMLPQLLLVGCVWKGAATASPALLPPPSPLGLRAGAILGGTAISGLSRKMPNTSKATPQQKPTILMARK